MHLGLLRFLAETLLVVTTLRLVIWPVLPLTIFATVLDKSTWAGLVVFANLVTVVGRTPLVIFPTDAVSGRQLGLHGKRSSGLDHLKGDWGMLRLSQVFDDFQKGGHLPCRKCLIESFSSP
jgi:hypothetical protein